MNIDEIIAAVDELAMAAHGDTQVSNALLTCRRSLANESWERFRIKHELYGSKRRRDTFSRRHKAKGTLDTPAAM